MQIRDHERAYVLKQLELAKGLDLARTRSAQIALAALSLASFTIVIWSMNRMDDKDSTSERVFDWIVFAVSTIITAAAAAKHLELQQSLIHPIATPVQSLLPADICQSLDNFAQQRHLQDTNGFPLDCSDALDIFTNSVRALPEYTQLLVPQINLNDHVPVRPDDHTHNVNTLIETSDVTLDMIELETLSEEQSDSTSDSRSSSPLLRHSIVNRFNNDDDNEEEQQNFEAQPMQGSSLSQ